MSENKNFNPVMMGERKLNKIYSQPFPVSVLRAMDNSICWDGDDETEADKVGKTQCTATVVIAEQTDRLASEAKRSADALVRIADALDSVVYKDAGGNAYISVGVN